MTKQFNLKNLSAIKSFVTHLMDDTKSVSNVTAEDDYYHEEKYLLRSIVAYLVDYRPTEDQNLRSVQQILERSIPQRGNRTTYEKLLGLEGDNAPEVTERKAFIYYEKFQLRAGEDKMKVYQSCLDRVNKALS